MVVGLTSFFLWGKNCFCETRNVYSTTLIFSHKTIRIIAEMLFQVFVLKKYMSISLFLACINTLVFKNAGVIQQLGWSNILFLCNFRCTKTHTYTYTCFLDNSLVCSSSFVYFVTLFQFFRHFDKDLISYPVGSNFTLNPTEKSSPRTCILC